MLKFQAHICWVINVDYKVRLGQVKSEFDLKSQKLTRSVQASKLSIFSVKSNSVVEIKISLTSWGRGCRWEQWWWSWWCWIWWLVVLLITMKIDNNIIKLLPGLANQPGCAPPLAILQQLNFQVLKSLRALLLLSSSSWMRIRWEKRRIALEKTLLFSRTSFLFQLLASLLTTCP